MICLNLEKSSTIEVSFGIELQLQLSSSNLPIFGYISYDNDIHLKTPKKNIILSQIYIIHIKYIHITIPIFYSIQI